MAGTGKSVFGGAAAVVVCLLAVCSASRSHRAYERDGLDRETQLMADQIAGRMVANLEQHRIALAVACPDAKRLDAAGRAAAWHEVPHPEPGSAAAGRRPAKS